MVRIRNAENEDHSGRQVHFVEYSRLGGGWEIRRDTPRNYSQARKLGYGGVYLPQATSGPVPIVNPSNPITNQFYWQ